MSKPRYFLLQSHGVPDSVIACLTAEATLDLYDWVCMDLPTKQLPAKVRKHTQQPKPTDSNGQSTLPQPIHLPQREKFYREDIFLVIFMGQYGPKHRVSLGVVTEFAQRLQKASTPSEPIRPNLVRGNLPLYKFNLIVQWLAHTGLITTVHDKQWKSYYVDEKATKGDITKELKHKFDQLPELHTNKRYTYRSTRA